MILETASGAVLAAPSVQLIAYSQDSLLSDVAAAVQELSSTSTWATQTSEYGVGALNVLPTITISGTPPSTLNDNSGNPTPFEQTLINNITGSNPAWGSADPSTIYLFVLPQGTQVNSGGLCCDPNVGYFGYHWEVQAGQTSVAYAVVCNCANFVEPPLTALDDVTTTINHELVESATNPLPGSNPAFDREDDAHRIWEPASSGAEVADMCQYNDDANYTPPGSTYMVQRTWSNASAASGQNPCVPVPNNGPYFNAYPVLTDTITLDNNNDYWGGAVTTQGVQIPIGQSKTIDVRLHSDGATSGPWTVEAYDLSDWLGTLSQPATTVSLDQGSGNDGDVLHLTITVNRSDPSLGGEGFVLSSTLNGQNNLWFGAVGQ